MTNVVLPRSQDICAEMLLIALACFAPWAYGSVDASSEYILYAGLCTAVGLRAIADWRSGERSFGSGPLYWALLAIVGIACLQGFPMSEKVIGIVSPGTLATRSAFLPQVMETNQGDALPPVPFPKPTISIDPNETEHALVRILAIFLLFDCASRTRLRHFGLVTFARALAINAMFLSVFSVAQGLTWNGKIFWVREANLAYPWGGPFFLHNHLAASLNLGLGMALGLLFVNLSSGRSARKAKVGRFYLIYMTGLITVGVIASQSRGGVIAMFVATVIVIAMFRLKLSTTLPALAAILGLSFLFMMTIGSSSSLARLGTISDALSSGLNGRAEVWQAAFKTWKEAPILGTGLGTYAESTYPNYVPTEPRFYNRFAAHGESEYAEMLVEGGLVGLGLLLVILFDLLRKTWIALINASTATRPLILGGLFGIAALATQSLADFPLHVAGVAVPAVILASKLYRLGLWNESDPTGRSLVSPRVITLKNAMLLVAGIALIPYQASQVKVEHLVEGARLPLPGSRWVTFDIPLYPEENLNAMKKALIEALKIRPDWTEGHLWLGQVQLSLYRHAAARALEISLETVEPEVKAESRTFEAASDSEPSEPEFDPDEVLTLEKKDNTVPPGEAAETPDVAPDMNPADANTDAEKPSVTATDEPETAEVPLGSTEQTDPLWLQKVVELLKKEQPDQVEAVVEHEPVRDFLIPAARSFLEARRCCPVMGVPHLELASLSYLTAGGDQTGIESLKRGIRLKGNHPEMLLAGARIAANLHDLELAQQCWRQYLQERPTGWRLVAEQTSANLKPDQILQVARAGGTKALFSIGMELYSSTLNFVYRVRFLEAALAAVPDDPTLSDDERIWFEGRIRGELAQYELARTLMRQAIDRQPMKEAWRLEYIELLMFWKCDQEAYRLSVIGSRLFPKNWRYPKLMRLCLDSATETESSLRKWSAPDQNYDR